MTWWILGGLLAAVLIATALGYILARRRPEDPAILNLNARIRAWWMLILIGGAALLAGRPAVIVLFALISILALRESHTRRLCYLAVPLQYAAIAFDAQAVFIIGIPIVAAILLITGGSKTTFWALMLCVCGLSYVPATGLLPAAFLVIVVQVSDVMQYVSGKLFGRHHIAPVLSPSKTIEGLAGGLLSATLLGAGMAPLIPLGPLQAALLAFLIATVGFLSGLLFSKLKRERGLKDWGTLLPGHGGILDRVDSLCLAAPAFFYLVKLL